MKKMFIAVWLVLLLMVIVAAACTKTSVASTGDNEPKQFQITALDGKQIGSVTLAPLPDGNARINVTMSATSVEGVPYIQPVLTRSRENVTEVFSTLERVDRTDPVSENSPVVSNNGMVLSFDALEKTRVLTLRLNIGETDQAISEVRLQQ